MARTEAKYAFTGSKHGKYSMLVEFPDGRIPVELRRRGYFVGYPTFAAMVQKWSSQSATGVSVGASVGVSVGVETPPLTKSAAVESSSPESQNSTGKSEKSDPLDDEVDEYAIFAGEQSNFVSLFVLPLEVSDQESMITPSTSSEVSLSCKSGSFFITAWKLAFLEHGTFRILVKVQQRWVKLKEPRPDYKEAVEDVLCVARLLASLKREPDVSEDKVRNHLLQGNVLSAAFSERLRQRRALIEKYIDLDPALKETDARRVMMSLIKEKKRVLVLDEGSDDEDDAPIQKKLKPFNPEPEDYESEDFYEEEADADDADEDEVGDSLCCFCDDGGYLLCCDGPCMRSFHPRPQDGRETDCDSLGFPENSDIDAFRKGWFCTNCKTKRHQCFICGGLGDSDPSLGRKREVFVCDAASCGKFYHPRCIAAKIIPAGGERQAREALAKGIRAGTETFTCPLHTCKKCGKAEQKKEKDLNLATCRRCPSAWHVKCLPRNLKFEVEKEGDDVRAWLIGKLYIVYCMDHKIDDQLFTPLRNHIKFRDKSTEPTTFKKPLTKVSTERHEFRPRSSSAPLGRSVDDARPPAQETSDDAATRVVDDIVRKSRLSITEDSMLLKLVLPSIYRRKEFNWLVSGRFHSILNGARAAVASYNQTKNWEDASLKCAKDQVEAICLEENHLRVFLAPTLHGKRYTSYGRHFTKVEKLRKVVEFLHPHIRDGDTIVDFSCGENTFSRMLHEELSASAKPNCQFKNFDIISPKDTFGFDRKDWLSVGVSECGPPDNLVIGLNPPFAYMDVFISHALSMNPRVLVLIVPPLKKPIGNYGYYCVLDDDTTMAEKSFYLPGSVHGLNDENMEQGNHVAPHLYIFVRPTTYVPPAPLPPPPPPPPPMLEAPRKFEKCVSPSVPAAASASATSSGHLFIPSQRRPRAPEPQKKTRWSGVEDGEIKTPPLPLSPPRTAPPPPRPHRPPNWHLPQPFSSGFHYPAPPHPGFLPAPPLPDPSLFHRSDPSRDPRLVARGGGGGGGRMHPGRFHGMHPAPFRDSNTRSHPPDFRDSPPGFRNLSPPGCREPPPGFGGDPRGHREEPPPGFAPAQGGWIYDE